MKHSTPKDGKEQYVFELDFQDKEVKFSKPIVYCSIDELCKDLSRLAKFYPSEWQFKITSVKVVEE